MHFGFEQKVDKALDKYKRFFGEVPPLYMKLADMAPTLLLLVEEIDSYLKNCDFSTEEKHALMLVISELNASQVCMSYHAEMVDLLKKPYESPHDEKVQILKKVTKSLFLSKGSINDEDIQEFTKAGYNKEQLFDIIHIITLKTLSNFSSNLVNKLD